MWNKQRVVFRTAATSHNLITDNIIYFSVLWLNSFPVNNRVSSKIWTLDIIVIKNLEYKKNSWLIIGTYCEVHDDQDLSNTMLSCTNEAIALGRTGNLKRAYKLFCINTGCILKHSKLTKYPMHQCVVNEINKQLGPAQYITYALILKYVSKIIYLS